MAEFYTATSGYETYDGAYSAYSADALRGAPTTPAERKVEEQRDWSAMRAALPDRLKEMGWSAAQIEGFLDDIPEEREESPAMGAIMQTTINHPDFVTLNGRSGVEPHFHIFGGEAFEQALLTDLEQGEI